MYWGLFSGDIDRVNGICCRILSTHDINGLIMFLTRQDLLLFEGPL